MWLDKESENYLSIIIKKSFAVCFNGLTINFDLFTPGKPNSYIKCCINFQMTNLNVLAVD